MFKENNKYKDHPLSMNVKYSKILTFLSPCAQQEIRNASFSKYFVYALKEWSHTSAMPDTFTDYFKPT